MRTGRRLRELVFGTTLALAATAACEWGVRALLASDVGAAWLGQAPGMRLWILAALERDAPHTSPVNSRRIDPHLGWTNPPGTQRLQGFEHHVNAQGLHATREFAPTAAPGTLRVEVFGDSFAFGAEVDDASSYAAKLERLAPGVEVLNFGVPGYGLDQMELRFAKEGRAFHPDVVVIGVCESIVPRVASPMTFWFKPRYELSDGQLVLRGVPVPSWERARHEQARRSRLFDLAAALFDRGAEYPERDLLNAIFRRFLREVHEAGARPIAIFAPVTDELDRVSEIPGMLAETCDREPGVCVDARPGFDAARAAGVALESGVHWSPAAHEIVAQVLAAHLPRRDAQAGEGRGPER